MSDGTVDYKAQHITIYNMDVSSTAVRESKIRVLKNSMYFLQRQENRKKKRKKKVAHVWIFHSSALEFEINVHVSNIRVPISVRDMQYEKETDEKICLICI